MYTMKASKQSPITTLLNCSGVIPHRVVIYRRVRVVSVSVGAMLNLQYGIITLGKNKRIVKRSMRSNGQYSQWELL